MAAHWLRSQNILNAIDHQVKLIDQYNASDLMRMLVVVP